MSNREKQVQKAIRALCEGDPDVPTLLSDLTMVCAGVIYSVMPPEGDKLAVDLLGKQLIETIAKVRFDIDGVQRPS